jgi:hypothetical protein
MTKLINKEDFSKSIEALSEVIEALNNSETKEVDKFNKVTKSQEEIEDLRKVKHD